MAAQPDDSAHRLDGSHQCAFVERNIARIGRAEEREKGVLARDVPPAITGRKTVGAVPRQFVDAFLQRPFHRVGAPLGHHAAQGIGHEGAQHVATGGHLPTIILDFAARRTKKKGEGLGTAQLARYDGARMEAGAVDGEGVGGQCPAFHRKAETWLRQRGHRVHQHAQFLGDGIVGPCVAIAHLPENVFRLNGELCVCQLMMEHYLSEKLSPPLIPPKGGRCFFNF